MNDAAKHKSEPVDIDAIKEEIDALRKSVATLTDHVGNGTATKLADQGKELYGRLHDGGERAIRAASHEIEERPLTSVLIAFAIGFAGGRLMAR